MKTFRLILFAYSCSVWLFLSDFFPNYGKFALASILLWGIFVLIPYNHVFVFDCLKLTSNDVYLEEYFEFVSFYEMSNPITKKMGMFQYLERLRDREIITIDEYNDLKDKMEAGENVDLMEIYYQKSGYSKYNTGISKIINTKYSELFLFK